MPGNDEIPEMRVLFCTCPTDRALGAEWSRLP